MSQRSVISSRGLDLEVNQRDFEIVVEMYH